MAVGLEPDDLVAELFVASPDEEHACVALERKGSQLTHVTTLPLQQLGHILLQEDLTHTHTHTHMIT